LLGTNLQLGAIVFYRITNTHSRNQILNDLLSKRCGSTYEAYWNGIPGAPNRKSSGMAAIIRQLDASRNEIVHWHVGIKILGDNDPIGPVGLIKPDVWPIEREADKRVITIEELSDFIGKADFARRSLNTFFLLLSKQLPEDENTKALREIYQQPASYPPPDTNPLSRNYREPESPPRSWQG
jgi:hypothetical protein